MGYATTIQSAAIRLERPWHSELNSSIRTCAAYHCIRTIQKGCAGQGAKEGRMEEAGRQMDAWGGTIGGGRKRKKIEGCESGQEGTLR